LGLQLEVARRAGLEGNALSSLATAKHGLSELKALCLDQNCLEALPAWIAVSRQCRVIEARGNQLKRVPLELRFLTNLAFLELEDNPSLLFPDPSTVNQGAKAVRQACEESVRRQLKRAGGAAGLAFLILTYFVFMAGRELYLSGGRTSRMDDEALAQCLIGIIASAAIFVTVVGVLLWRMEALEGPPQPVIASSSANSSPTSAPTPGNGLEAVPPPCVNGPMSKTEGAAGADRTSTGSSVERPDLAAVKPRHEQRMGEGSGTGPEIQEPSASVKPQNFVKEIRIHARVAYACCRVFDSRSAPHRICKIAMQWEMIVLTVESSCLI
jgi:hypothetical protein